MTEEVHEARRNRAEAWLEDLEEKGRDALIDWVQLAIETMELFDCCTAELDAQDLRPCVTTNGLGSHFVHPRIKPGEDFHHQKDLMIHVPAKYGQDKWENWISICTDDGCAVIHDPADLRHLARGLLYVWARWGKPWVNQNQFNPRSGRARRLSI